MGAEKTFRRFARECRRLASECVEGTAPPLIAGDFDRCGQHCAMGWALARCDREGRSWEAFWRMHRAIEAAGLLVPNGNDAASAVLIEANNTAPADQRHLAVVFPLLMLADAAEATAAKLGGKP